MRCLLRRLVFGKMCNPKFLPPHNLLGGSSGSEKILWAIGYTNPFFTLKFTFDMVFMGWCVEHICLIFFWLQFCSDRTMKQSYSQSYGRKTEKNRLFVDIFPENTVQIWFFRYGLFIKFAHWALNDNFVKTVRLYHQYWPSYW